jgi:hypothetical protein
MRPGSGCGEAHSSNSGHSVETTLVSNEGKISP